MEDPDDVEQPLGWVPVDGRDSLPFALVHGESLVAAASWALGEAEVQLFDASVGFDQVRDSGRDLVLHDPLCPLTPVAFVSEAVERCRRTGQVVVGYRPVTDTVKHRLDDRLGATVDRSLLRLVASPVVIPAAVLATRDDLDAGDLAALVADLADTGPIDWLLAPALAARITTASDLPGLEALSRSLSGEPDLPS